MQGRNLPQYEYDPQLQHGPVAKRRRIVDAGDTDGKHASWMQQPLQQDPSAQLQYAGHGHALAYADLSLGNGITPVNSYGSNASNAIDPGPGMLSTPAGQQQQQQWNLEHTPQISSFPEVSLFQQPFFFQHVDPSAYNSPWPPAEAAAASYGNLAVPGEQYSMSSAPAGLSVPNTVPVYSEPTGIDAGNQLGQTTEFQQGYQDLYAAPFGNNEPQSRLDMRDPSSLYYEDASMHLKIQSLSILENLARRLLDTLVRRNFAQIQDLIHGKDSEEGQAYATLKNLFDQTRKVYTRETPFINAVAIQMLLPSQQETIRQANTATFISSILGAHDVSFFHLNEFFLETFVPLGHRVLKWQGAIFLELKTQTYISALMNSNGSPEAMLDELFPSDLDAQILSRHPDAPSLSPSEQDFIDRSGARKNYLLAEQPTQAGFHELPKKYQWTDFVREFVSCINKNVDSLTNGPVRMQNMTANAPPDRTISALPQASPTQPHQEHSSKDTLHVSASHPATPNSTTSLPTRKLTTPTSTTRQPWTKAEEDALVSGLERVAGPHWSQILALYGRGGSQNEVLKDRNQVQLKDKARNLKLWYLKTGREVPVALRGVTGELRKRGGARARAALGALEEAQMATMALTSTETAGSGRGEAAIDPSLATPNMMGGGGGQGGNIYGNG